jgi:hypothetical protein
MRQHLLALQERMLFQNAGAPSHVE